MTPQSKKRSKLFLTTLPFLAPFMVLAEEGKREHVASQDPTEVMVVTATKNEKSLWEAPVSVSAVNRYDIQMNNGDSIAEALRDVNGVEIYDNGLAGRKQIMIRGEDPSRVLLLIDGQEVSYHRSGHGSSVGLMIDMESVERVEVIKGPHSVLYGSQAIGGVVNFITRKGDKDNKPFNGDAKIVYDGATDGWSEMGSVYGTLGDGLFDYRISGTYSDHNNRRTREGNLDNTDFGNNSLSAWFGLNLDNQKLGLSLERYKLDTKTYVTDEEMADMNSFLVSIPYLKREKAGLFYDYEFDHSIVKRFHFDGYYQTLQRTFLNELSMLGPVVPDMDVNTNTQDEQKTVGLNFQFDLKPIEKMNLTLGAQYLRDKVSQDSAQVLKMYYKPSPAMPFPLFDYTKNTRSNNHWQQEQVSIFAQNDWEFADNWNWTLGVRQYWIKSKLIDGNKEVNCTNNQPTISPCQSTSSIDTPDTHRDNSFVTSTGLTYSGFDNTILRASFGQGYVYPTLSHLYNVTSAHSQTIYGNSNLEPETSNNYEIGFRYVDRSWLADASIYYSDSKNYITDLACNGSALCDGATGSSALYYANVNKAKSYGLELTLEYLGWEVIPYVKANYLRRKIETEKYSTYDSGNPTLSGSIGLKHLYLGDKFDLDSHLYMRYATKAKKYSPEKTYEYNGWTTVNLSLSTTFGDKRQYQIGLDLNNLLNKNYRTAYESIPSAKFHAVVSASIRF